VSHSIMRYRSRLLISINHFGKARTTHWKWCSYGMNSRWWNRFVIRPDMRRETVELIRKAIAKNRRAYVLVNHRAKGNAPLTVQGSVLGVLWPVKMTTDSLRICFKTGTPSSIVCSD